MHFFIFQKFTDDEKCVWKNKAIQFRKTPEYAKLKHQHKLRNPSPRRRKKFFKTVSIDSDGSDDGLEDEYWEISSTILEDDNKCTYASVLSRGQPK